jgi:hypothetical protein
MAGAGGGGAAATSVVACTVHEASAITVAAAEMAWIETRTNGVMSVSSYLLKASATIARMRVPSLRPAALRRTLWTLLPQYSTGPPRR